MPPLDPHEQARRFFEALYHGAPEGSRITLAIPRGKGYLGDHLPVDPDVAAERSVELDDQGTKGVYYGVAPRVEGVPKPRIGKTHELVGLGALWLDLDYGSVGHAATDCPPDEEAASALLLEVLQEGVPDPSAIVRTGGGFQILWFLDRLVPAIEGAARCKALQEKFISAGERRGWCVDNTATAPRILRVPGTTNRKNGEDRPVELIHLSDVRYAPELFPAEIPRGVPDAEVRDSIDNGGPRDAEQDRMHVREYIAKSPEKGLARAILEGRPLKKGRRDEDLKRACGIVAGVAPKGARLEDIVEVLYPMIDATQANEDDPENPAPTREDALNKLRGSMDSAARYREGKRRDAEKLARGWGEKKEESVGESISPYTNEELETIAASEGCSVEELKKLWIVQHKSAYYVLRPSGRQIVSREELPIAVAQLLARAPIEFTRWKGNQVFKKTSAEILEDYGTLAKEVVADATIQRTRYDRESETLHEAVCIKRVTEARFDSEVNKWLSLLGGEGLLDYVACVPDLRYPLPALVIKGPHSIGKTMLADGLARIWNTGPTDLEDALDTFNSLVMNCPLVFADEKLPSNWHNKVSSATLRKLVASSNLTLRRKGIPAVRMILCMRLIIAANNAAILSFDEDYTAEDTEAIAGRFIYLEGNPLASEYLLSELGGRQKGTKDWVDGDRIAMHALWLHQNRVVKPGQRFMVEGDAKAIVDQLVTSGGVRSMVVEWIARALDDATKAKPASSMIRVGKGQILVNAALLRDNWDLYMEEYRVRTTETIAHALRGISHPKQVQKGPRGRVLRYFDVRPELILATADRLGIGDLEAMSARISAEVIFDKIQDPTSN